MARQSRLSAPSQKQTELLKKQQDAELLKQRQEADEEVDSDAESEGSGFDLEEDKDDGIFYVDSDVDAQEEEDKDTEEADKASKDKSSKPRRAFVDPLEIKALILQGTKSATTKAGKLLDRLSRQLEKIQTKMSKKKATGPRKLSAYNVYTKKHMVDVQDIESKLRMKELGQRWKALSAEERAPYVALAAEQSAVAV